jgi:hypothetical protein
MFGPEFFPKWDDLKRAVTVGENIAKGDGKVG